MKSFEGAGQAKQENDGDLPRIVAASVSFG